MMEDGRLKTSSEAEWKNIATELIYTYCLSPIKEAGKLFRED